MPGFLYFLPGCKQSDIPSNLSRWGLDHVADDGEGVTLHARGCMRGPDGQPGMVIGSAANFSPEQVKFDAENQTWQKFPKAWERADGIAEPHIGYYTASGLPTESDLRRAHQISGERWRGPDSQSWLIPHARVITDEGTARTNLPMSFTLDDETGDWIGGQVLPKYRGLWNHATACLDAMLAASAAAAASGEQGYTWTIPDHRPLIQEAFRVNYRVSEMELAVLGLLVTGIAGDIAQIITDAGGWERIKKKAEAAIGAG